MAAEFLMLAHDYDRNKHGVAGWYMSEKLDGMRAAWDGGITRGIPCVQVPWANVEKHGRFKEERIATGMWTRYGQPIYFPDDWLPYLPKYPLDGELWAGRGMFQHVTSTAKELTPGEGWDRIGYYVFDSQPYAEWFLEREIKNPNFKKEIDNFKCMEYVQRHRGLDMQMTNWCNILARLQRDLVGNPHVYCHTQVQLPWATADAEALIAENLAMVSMQGGEGLMLRKNMSCWEPKRTYDLLKVKKLLDAEAIVTGYTWGRETDKGSKLLGLMGALIVDFRGKRLELSGFTDAERVLQHTNMGIHGRMLPIEQQSAVAGKECEPHWANDAFPRGTVVTFKYRELTNDGIPKEARYWRKRS